MLLLRYPEVRLSNLDIEYPCPERQLVVRRTHEEGMSTCQSKIFEGEFHVRMARLSR
jgi:hypothetical protein